jgi:azurin
MLNIKSSLALVGVAASVFANTALAGTCDVNVEATASMAFSVKEITVPKTCKEITLNLKNTGTMAKSVMGHNIVISKTADMQAILADGNTAGLANNYVKQNDERVVGHTNVIGGGESTSVKIKLANVKLADAYSFYCSFPGHASVMKGAFKLM